MSKMYGTIGADMCKKIELQGTQGIPLTHKIVLALDENRY